MIQRPLPRETCVLGLGDLSNGLPTTHHFAWYAHLIKLLLVIFARFRAVVGHKDKLLAWGLGQPAYVNPCAQSMSTFTPQHLECLLGSGKEVITGP